MSEPMPEPVDVWLYGNAMPGEWSATSVMFPNPYTRIAINGPYKIVPGMMSLDELAKHGLYIRYGIEERWYVHHYKGVLTSGSTALEAQWGATCLARGE